MKRSWKKKIAVLGLAGGTVIAGGTAFALWTSNATGPGSAKALSAVNVTVNAVTGTADLYPGFTGGDVSFSLTNTNPYPITFTGMTPGAITTSNPACTASNISVASMPTLATPIPVGPNTTTATQTISDAVSMISAAPDACQGVTFTVTLNLTGAQSS